jgi:hypothetical protein
VPPATVFLSHAQNREDVVLWRALATVPAGRYVDAATNRPDGASTTLAFYERGWSGIVVEPLPDLAEAHRAERPRDVVIDTTDVAPWLADAVGTDQPADDVHVMVVDAEGSEADVLAGVDLRTFRPWVLVIRATAPASATATHDAWEAGVLAAGYRACLFDGMSRFYVAQEHADALQSRLSYPACALDQFVDARAYAAEQGRAALIDEVRRWRVEALTWWPGTGGSASAGELNRVTGELAAAKAELAATRATLSWRITRPIRVLRRRADRA